MAGKRDFCPIPLFSRDGSLVAVETKVTPGRWGGGNDVLFCISRDITEREKAKEIVKIHDSILNAVSFAAHGFLQNDRWDDRIDEVLKEFGSATGGVDRVYLFQNHTDMDGTLLCSQRFEWCAPPGTESQIENPELLNADFNAAGFSRWIQLLEKGCVLSGDVDTFPEGERELLRSQGILSLAVVPVISDSQWWGGFIGFDECKRRREWSPAEIDALCVAADILGSAIHQTTMKEMFKQPVEQSLVGTYLLCDGIFEYINPRFAEIFGYDIDELIHIENMETLTYPEDLLLFKEQMRRRLSGGEVRSVHYELRGGLSKTNELIYLDAYGSVIEFKGKTAIVGNLMDITERKLYEKGLRESLDEKVVLLNEIHHRVKNNLQIISAFIELQMIYLDDGAGLESLIECDNRILTMALIHESLYKSDNFSSIPMKDHVDQLIKTIGSPGSRSSHRSYDPDIEEIILPLDTAMPCSLVITEFINITQKCMPDGTDEQRIGIGMHRESDSRISLTLRDDSICLPADVGPGSSDLLELGLIHRLVTDQLKGTIGIWTEQGGLKITVQFPPDLRR
ncbi:histidine kinase dimerization/phosphoacceptor domain -containing protein [Methanogenium cariaci]|uniref:histidine kinase dimerization/phosphoacceptor domain -containing protein n=1 Tax=Methanogenium cariaci TaxID=2197 RepID=UPI000785F910|nr:histidine kinase dimerization/phosphoacceptor domain -containing protein [Methanogenium cariaci]